MTITKDPDARLDFTVSWAAWLAPLADTLLTSTWASTPTGLTLDTPTHDATTATVWLSGGTEKIWYRVTNHIVTTDGRIDDRTLDVHVVSR